MKNKTANKIIEDKRRKISKDELRARIEGKLLNIGVADPALAQEKQIYEACVYAIKEIMLENRNDFKKRIKAVTGKKVCYLCMEFLVGRALKNDVISLGIYSELSNILESFGTSFDKIYSYEVDPGLGNGGLGRLAACFMDSLTANDYAANGYTLLYENGLFKQRIIDGEQIELPDDWLSSGGGWLVPHPERSVNIRFGGTVEERVENGRLVYVNTEYDEVRAVPYDILIPGISTNAVNTIRLWRARSVDNVATGVNTHGNYVMNLRKKGNADKITKQLYPEDNYDEGKLLRLSQQYLLVSASLQSIITDYLADYGSLNGFEEKISIHINDTHPALAIPELMRILIDVYSYSWDDAWSIVVKTISYTNHTVLPEALECWRVDLFSLKLPRIFMIIQEINKRFTADLWSLYPGDWDRISRMSIIAYNQVRMANLSVVGSHTVNGVSKLHSEILKQTVFHDFYKNSPWKFINVTNGVAHRRWLNNANPALCSLCDELIGTGFRENPNELTGLKKYINDASVLEKVNQVKHYNKESFAYYAFNKSGVRIDAESVFDIQIKRMHEYKRQLLNVLKILALYNEITDNPNAEIHNQTFIFGCKAAPGYTMAKSIIKLIWYLSRELENNPLTRDRLKVLFMEDYNVSLAEALIPSGDISEQISLAGKEASGTGCMKLMMNGAITLGTLDGANIEIMDSVGKDNIYIFGMNTREVDELWKNGYVSHKYYQSSPVLKNAVDRMYSPIGGESFSHIADYLIGFTEGIADPFMCLRDFDSYYNTYKSCINDYKNRMLWSKKSLMNTASSGIFASDNTVKQYAENIWHISPIKDL